MLVCSKCGQALRFNEDYCPMCGSPIEKPVKTAEKPVKTAEKPVKTAEKPVKTAENSAIKLAIMFIKILIPFYGTYCYLMMLFGWSNYNVSITTCVRAQLIDMILLAALILFIIAVI